jgi:hypothetical protein
MATRPQQALPPEFLPGYTELSAFMGSDRDGQIYRRFDTLSSRNLLYLQSEICCIETRLDELDKDDLEELQLGGEEQIVRIWQSNKDWSTFVREAEAGGSDVATVAEKRQAEKMSLVLKLRKLLPEYGELSTYALGYDLSMNLLL